MSIRRLPVQNNVNPEVALVFPPLAEMNFGLYYPSTAVLAGYLSSKKIGSIQFDLNEEFALYLLDPCNLERLAHGELNNSISIPCTSMPAFAARILIRNRQHLFDDKGRHRFRDVSSDLAYLLKIVAQAYLTDKPLPAIISPDFINSPEANLYRNFFEQYGLFDSLPSTIHTLGISIPMGPQLLPALLFAAFAKNRFPDLDIVIGGPCTSLMTEDDIEAILKAFPAVSAIIRFEGEYPLAALVEQKRSGKIFPYEIRGISFIYNGKVFHNPPSAGPNLSSLAFAEYDSEILSRLSKPEIGISATRGCYWGKCAYCDYTELYRGSPAFRARTPLSFVDEMAYQAQKHNANSFSLITEAIPPAFAENISEQIIKRSLEIKWHSFAMVDRRFTPEVLEKMFKAGCEYLGIGVETITDRVLALMNKASTKEYIIKFLKNAKTAGLDIKINLIPDLPSTSFEEAMESLSYFGLIQDSFDYVSYFPFETTRSSHVGCNPGQYGLEKLNSGQGTGQAQYMLNHIEVSDPAMTLDERAQAYAKYKEFAAYINSRQLDRALCAVGEISNDSKMVLAEDILDLCQTEEGVQCFNALTKERFMMPPESWIVIERARAKQPFSRPEFIGWFADGAMGEHYLNKFLEKGMLALDKSARIGS